MFTIFVRPKKAHRISKDFPMPHLYLESLWYMFTYIKLCNIFYNFTNLLKLTKIPSMNGKDLFNSHVLYIYNYSSLIYMDRPSGQFQIFYLYPFTEI